MARGGLTPPVATGEDKPIPHPVLDNDYEIRPCPAEPQEDPEQNRADAERAADREPQL